MWVDNPPTCVLLLPPGPRQVAYSSTSVFPGPASLLDQTSVFCSHLCHALSPRCHSAHSPSAPARLGGPTGNSPSSCHHTSCRARRRLHFCCRTCGRSWMPPRYRDKPPRPGDQRSGPTGSKERGGREVGLHLKRLVGDSQKTGKWSDEGTRTVAVTLQMPRDETREEKQACREKSNDELSRTEWGPWDSYVEALILSTSECDCLWRQGL